jgi:hypothetical protein
MDIHTAEPLVPEPSLVEVEIAIGKLKSYKSSGTDQIPAKLIKAWGETLYSEIHELVCSILNKEELPQQWKKSIIMPIHKKCDTTDCNNYSGISLLSTAYKILSNILLSRHPNSGQNQNIRIANESFENVEKFKYLGTTLTNRNDIHDEIKIRLNSGDACYYSVQNLLSFRLI